RNFLILFILHILCLSGYAQPFAPGNLVVVRYGDGSTSLSSSSAVPVFLDEYTVAGGLSPQRSLAMPVAVSGSNYRFTGSGNSTTEGLISLSQDGRYLTLMGYDANVGTGSVNSTSNS